VDTNKLTNQSIHAEYVIQDQLLENKKVQMLNRKVLLLQTKLNSVEDERDEYMSIVGGMHKQLNDLANGKVPGNIEKDIKNIIKRCAGSNKSFNKIIDNIEFNSSLPIDIQKSIEKCLKRKLGIKHNDFNFFELIMKGKSEGLLNEEMCDYLHSIRKQRNLFAHDEVDGQTRFARILFVLTAAALAWTNLNCGSK